MKIRTQFLITMILFGVMLIIMSVSVILTSRHVGRLNEQEEIAHRIERGASDLGYLSNDFLLYGENQQFTRCESKFSSLSSDLSRLNPDTPEQAAIVKRIRENQERWQAVFTDVAATLPEDSLLRHVPAWRDVTQVAWSRIAVQNQGMVFDAIRVSELLRNQKDRLRRRNLILIVALLVIFGAYFLTNYFIGFRRTLKSITELRDGTRMIGSGNLDFVIQTRYKDEIGELARAFNRMTANLQRVTTSKTALEKEVAQRRKAEEDLRHHREWLSVTLSSIGDAVVATDTAGRITFINPVANGLTGWESEEALGRPIQSVVRTLNEKTGEPAEDIVERVLAEGCIVNMANHTALVARNGNRIPIEDSAAPIRDGNGNMIGVVLVFRDVTEKRQAQAALGEAADRLRIVADFTYDWEYWRSEDNRFLHVSPSCERVTGYTREEFIQDPGLLPRIIHPEDRERISDHMQNMRGGACELEFRIIHQDDRVRWLSHVCRPVVDSQGRPMGRRASNRDITGRKQAEESLRKSEHRYHSLFETMNEGFALHEILCDAEGRPSDYRFLEANPAFERQTGLKAEELIGRTLLEVLPDADPFWIERCGRVALTGRSDQFEYWSGPLERCYEVSAYQTEPGRFAAVFLDITERKKAEKALRDSESRFRMLSETAGRLLASDNPRGIVEELCSEVMEQLDCQSFFNFLVDEETGRLRLNARAGIPDEEAEKIRWLDYGEAVCGRVGEDGKRLVVENIGHITDLRTERLEFYGIRAYACHPLIVGGRIVGTLSFGSRTRDRFAPEDLAVMKTVAGQVATATDRMMLIEELRTSRDKLEIRVRERTAELEQRARQLSHLASELTLAEERERRRLAGILHDNLQQLLVGAKIHVELLANGLDKGRRKMIQDVLDLIVQSLKVSRSLTAELSPPRPEQGGLSASLRWLGRWMEETHGLKVDFSIDPLTDPEREDFSVLLFQSVRELLFNVVKHAGVMSARVDMHRDEDGRHRIVVSDRGVGLDTEALWENAYHGSGFGLFSIRERMMLMGGGFEVESRPGEGTSFSLLLPPEQTKCVQVEPPNVSRVQAGAGLHPVRAGGGRLRVMLVDDHEVMRNGLSTLLGRSPDIEVVGEISNGEEAVRAARKISPDVILMDVDMPKMNGIEATRRIHSIFPHIRIIILSVYEDQGIASSALDAGASAFITKSDSAEVLLSTIRGGCGS